MFFSPPFRLALLVLPLCGLLAAATAQEPKKERLPQPRPAVTTRTVVERPVAVADEAAATGTIRGVVFEDYRFQPEIGINLLDPAGKLIATKTTQADGSFQFSDVPPGSYRLYSVKPYLMSQGEAAVIVAPGKVVVARVQIDK